MESTDTLMSVFRVL